MLMNLLRYLSKKIQELVTLAYPAFNMQYTQYYLQGLFYEGTPFKMQKFHSANIYELTEERTRVRIPVMLR